MKFKHTAVSAVLALATAGAASTALAYHDWNNYHWARTTTFFDLKVINSTTSDWDPYVAAAVNDWTFSSVLNLLEDTSGDTSSKTRRSCNGGAGTLRICNLAYGYNGWLGIAGISIDTKGHITTGYTKLNDSYFSSAYYNTPLWKQSVTCQELGHNIGLDHQDEDFDNTSLNTCMDYQDPPTADPNDHDYDELEAIYGHTDSYNSYSSGSGGGGGGSCNAPPGKGCNAAGAKNDVGWGASLGRRGNAETFIRIDPDGTMHLTHVTWAIGY